MLGHDFPRLPVVDPEGSRCVIDETWEKINESVESYQLPNQHLWLRDEEEQMSLYEVARGYHSQPETSGYALEFGSWCCVSAIVMAKAMIARNDDCLPVVTVDPYKFHPTNPFSPEIITYLWSHWIHHCFADSIYHNVVRVISEDLTFMKTWNNPIRLAFIDTTGQYAHTKAEIEACLPHLVDDGWLVFHDYYEPYQDGLIDAVDEFILNQREWNIQPYKFVDEIGDGKSMIGIHFIERL